jgi:molybdopterin-guanine dinucleotide biosynthesis protein A
MKKKCNDTSFNALIIIFNMQSHQDITASIIAGGRSRRFGRDKLLYKYKGIALIEHVANALKNIFDEIIIIANDNKKFSFLDLPVYPDIIPDLGPISGVYSALCNSKTHKNFCFAGDLPFLNAEFIKYMISVSDDHDIVIPFYDNFYEALHAIYTKNCIKHISSNITAGKYQVIRFYDKCDLRKITISEIKKYTDPYIVFRNINYIKDLD